MLKECPRKAVSTASWAPWAKTKRVACRTKLVAHGLVSQESCCHRILGTMDRGEKQLALPLTCRRAVPKNVAQFGNESALERPKSIPGTWAPKHLKTLGPV